MIGRLGRVRRPARQSSNRSSVIVVYPTSFSQSIWAAKAAGLTEYFRKAIGGRGVTWWYIKIGIESFTANPQRSNFVELYDDTLDLPAIKQATARLDHRGRSLGIELIDIRSRH